jgi:hypothetical protein
MSTPSSNRQQHRAKPAAPARCDGTQAAWHGLPGASAKVLIVDAGKAGAHDGLVCAQVVRNAAGRGLLCTHPMTYAGLATLHTPPAALHAAQAFHPAQNALQWTQLALCPAQNVVLPGAHVASPAAHVLSPAQETHVHAAHDDAHFASDTCRRGGHCDNLHGRSSRARRSHGIRRMHCDNLGRRCCIRCMHACLLPMTHGIRRMQHRFLSPMHGAGRGWSSFYARNKAICAGNMTICSRTNAIRRPQTGHATAQVCPSKHPDGFREALY